MKKILIILLILFISGCANQISLEKFGVVKERMLSDDLNLPVLSTKDFVKVNVSYTDKLFLDGNCKRIIMPIHSMQIYSIDTGMNGKIDYRPQTHDLMKDIFDGFGIELLMIKIDDIENEIYKARFIVRQGNKVLDLDARPSDSIAMAVRYGKDVYVKKSLMDKGEKIC